MFKVGDVVYCLGFVDPSGGPFVSLGSRVEGREVIQISISADDRVRLRVK